MLDVSPKSLEIIIVISGDVSLQPRPDQGSGFFELVPDHVPAQLQVDHAAADRVGEQRERRVQSRTVQGGALRHSRHQAENSSGQTQLVST